MGLVNVLLHMAILLESTTDRDIQNKFIMHEGTGWQSTQQEVPCIHTMHSTKMAMYISYSTTIQLTLHK